MRMRTTLEGAQYGDIHSISPFQTFSVRLPR
jgi:hypothetical protein